MALNCRWEIWDWAVFPKHRNFAEIQRGSCPTYFKGITFSVNLRLVCSAENLPFFLRTHHIPIIILSCFVLITSSLIFCDRLIAIQSVAAVVVAACQKTIPCYVHFKYIIYHTEITKILQVIVTAELILSTIVASFILEEMNFLAE